MSKKSDESRRRNGAKSKGPITVQGKLTSSRNAVRHGLLASTIVMSLESEAAFRQFTEDLAEIYQPETIDERNCVESMAACRWRIERLWAMERATMDNELSRQVAVNPAIADQPLDLRAAEAFRTIVDSSRTFDVMSRYSTRYEREFDRALRRFKEFRAGRAETVASRELPPAAHQLQKHESQNT